MTPISHGLPTVPQMGVVVPFAATTESAAWHGIGAPVLLVTTMVAAMGSASLHATARSSYAAESAGSVTLSLPHMNSGTEARAPTAKTANLRHDGPEGRSRQNTRPLYYRAPALERSRYARAVSHSRAVALG